MSWYYFIASDRPLEELTVGIEVLNKNAIRIQDESKTLNICTEDDCSCAEMYTKLPCVVYVEFGCWKGIGECFLNYIRRQTAGCRLLEIWSTWPIETETPEIRSVKAEELSIQDLTWIFGQKFYTRPQCLKLYKWTTKKHRKKL